MNAPAKTRVNTELDTVLSDLLKSVKKRPEHGEIPMSLTDKMKIIDRVLKWEAIKAKLNDGEWGAGFAE
jgi:hypothetical protein